MRRRKKETPQAEAIRPPTAFSFSDSAGEGQHAGPSLPSVSTCSLHLSNGLLWFFKKYYYTQLGSGIYHGLIKYSELNPVMWVEIKRRSYLATPMHLRVPFSVYIMMTESKKEENEETNSSFVLLLD
ncbi:hypothetical protein TNCT_347671 [Trichonephila clavata]|uniref:Uncharacterized protein n=1 Tax=Trichonephila clavata TaxID=2740835 RepID=A0A8X6H6H9_TRICU|nr:hypothetical protein TNCT_347671 [Trichonephila clavata]